MKLTNIFSFWNQHSVTDKINNSGSHLTASPIKELHNMPEKDTAFFSNIIKDFETVASAIEKAFKNLFNHAPSWLNIAAATITYVSPLVETLITLSAGAADAAEAQDILTGVETDLAAASQLIKTVNAETTLPGVLNQILASLPTLLALVKVKNPELVAQIEVYTTLITKELEALLNSIPATSKSALLNK
jgi:hypothetical protein